MSNLRIAIFKDRATPIEYRAVKDIEQAQQIVSNIKKTEPETMVWLETKQVDEWIDSDIPLDTVETEQIILTTGEWQLVTGVNLTQEHLNKIAEEIKKGIIKGNI